MTSQEFLDLEVCLLLVKHGKRAVLRAMARRMQASDEALEAELEKLRRAEYVSSARKKRAAGVFEIDSLLLGSDDKAHSLRQLFARYENRTFLPELKDVTRFFDRHGKPTPKWKSRVLAAGPLFRFIGDLPIAEIEKLLAEAPSKTEVSSLGMIADEILGRNKSAK